MAGYFKSKGPSYRPQRWTCGVGLRTALRTEHRNVWAKFKESRFCAIGHHSPATSCGTTDLPC